MEKMEQLSIDEVSRVLLREGIVRDIHDIAKSRGKVSSFIGFENEQFKWYVCGILGISESHLTEYLALFQRHFGQPIKEFGEPVIFQQTVPEFYVEFLNRMNAFLFLGICINKGYINVEKLAKVGNFQHGASVMPPINLFNNQAFYGHSNEDSSKVELVRICPYEKRRFEGRMARIAGYLFDRFNEIKTFATLEYMVCYRK